MAEVVFCPSVCLFCFVSLGKKKYKERQTAGWRSLRVGACLRDQSLPLLALCTTLISMSKEAKTCNTIFSRQKKKKKNSA